MWTLSLLDANGSVLNDPKWLTQMKTEEHTVFISYICFFINIFLPAAAGVGLLCQGLTGSCQTGCQGKINPRRRFSECLFRSVRGLRAGLRTAGLIDPQLVIRPALQQLLPLFWILPRSPQWHIKFLHFTFVFLAFCCCIRLNKTKKNV